MMKCRQCMLLPHASLGALVGLSSSCQGSSLKLILEIAFQHHNQRTLGFPRESPLSQKLALRELREGAGKSLATCLKTEYRAVAHLIDDHSDFDEGIRALLIDKDGKPKWQHASLKQVEIVAVFSSSFD